MVSVATPDVLLFWHFLNVKLFLIAVCHAITTGSPYHTNVFILEKAGYENKK